MTPDAPGGIYQTKVSTTPSYRLEAKDHGNAAQIDPDTKV
jgi:hypothetical protein